MNSGIQRLHNAAVVVARVILILYLGFVGMSMAMLLSPEGATWISSHSTVLYAIGWIMALGMLSLMGPSNLYDRQ
jgi:hypothetical protein